MNNNVCPICGTELTTSILDYSTDKRVDPLWLEDHPLYEEVMDITVGCKNCDKRRKTGFFKQYFNENEMLDIAKN